MGRPIYIIVYTEEENRRALWNIMSKNDQRGIEESHTPEDDVAKTLVKTKKYSRQKESNYHNST